MMMSFLFILSAGRPRISCRCHSFAVGATALLWANVAFAGGADSKGLVRTYAPVCLRTFFVCSRHEARARV
jgi:hypothetical protein